MNDKRVEREVRTDNAIVKVYITIIRGNDKAAETRFRKYCGKLVQGRGQR